MVGHTTAANVRLRLSGTNAVPLAIELGFPDGGQLDGCRPIPHAPGTFRVEQRLGKSGGHGLPALSDYIAPFTPFEP